MIYVYFGRIGFILASELVDLGLEIKIALRKNRIFSYIFSNINLVNAYM